MAYTQLKPHLTKGARVEELSRDPSHHLLSIPSGKADRYRLAQLDDYAKTKREDFPLRYPLTLSLTARTSSESVPGTWGFGLWNDPFGLSLGFGGNPFRLPALPNAVWFFGASSESYLSFQEHPGSEQRSVQTQGEPQSRSSLRSASTAANGFLAQTFRSPKFHPLLMAAGLAFPFSRKWTRRLMGRIIADEETGIGVGVTQWHRYRLDWREDRASFEVDDALVFESSASPHPPLGLVIWIDNQYAAFTPDGKIGFGVLENSEAAWLEVKDIELK